MLPERSGALELADGRSLGYNDWGPADAPAIVYCHGFPGCRREVELARQRVDRAGAAVRIVAFDRPGYGLSTFQPRRTFLHWPIDLAEAADRLGIGRFAALGGSGGSPYALATGLKLADRVTRIGIVVGAAPVAAPGMARALAWPSRNRLVRRIQLETIAVAFRLGRADRIINRSLAALSPVDQAALRRPEVRRWYSQVFAETVVQGGRGAAYEAQLYRRDWGFRPQDVLSETYLWYGGRDANVPAAVGRWLHAAIPHSHFTLWPQHGHFTWALSDDCLEVIASLTGGAEPMGANRWARDDRSGGRRR